MSGGGGNEPNLTPFIDLFSVLICFLLMTAAWVQLESMPTSIEKTTTSEAPPTEAPPPVNDEKKVSLAVTVFKDRVVLKEDEIETVVPNLGGDVAKDRIQTLLGTWRQRFPKKKDVVLNTDASVLYGDMIKMYDLLVASDWPDVGINPQ
ncbi:MAG: biopolymer transporter ExbD [Bdellovibrio sp.]|nr:biopolymer transporter ExbD [Bdellovibrio sp.]